MEIEDYLANLDSKTKKRFKLASELEQNRIKVPSVGMNLALKGGLGRGRITTIHGGKSAGKTAFTQLMIAQAQKAGLSCAFVDVEHTYDPEWSARLGVDNKKLALSKAKTTGDVTEDVVSLLESEIDIVVVDSISELIPIAFLDDKKELKRLEDSQKMASVSSDLAKMVPMFNYSNSNSALIFISQQRNNMSYAGGVTYSGGKATEFGSSTIIKLTGSGATTDQISGEIYNGDRITQELVGRPITWLIQFNKLGPMNRMGKYDFYYDGSFVGIDNIGEILDYSDKYGLIERTGTGWYTIDGEKIQGKAKAVAFLKDHPEIISRLENDLDGII